MLVNRASPKPQRKIFISRIGILLFVGTQKVTIKKVKITIVINK